MKYGSNQQIKDWKKNNKVSRAGKKQVKDYDKENVKDKEIKREREC